RNQFTFRIDENDRAAGARVAVSARTQPVAVEQLRADAPANLLVRTDAVVAGLRRHQLHCFGMKKTQFSIRAAVEHHLAAFGEVERRRLRSAGRSTRLSVGAAQRIEKMLAEECRMNFAAEHLDNFS